MRAGLIGIAIVTAMLLAMATTGCVDDGPDYAAISAGGNNGSNRAGNGGSSANTGGANTQSPGAAGAGIPGTPQPADAEGEGEETEENTTLVDHLEITEVEVDAPYPDFEGEGRYDVTVHCVTDVYEEAQVYRVVAIDKEGNVVGEQERQLVLPMTKVRSFTFSSWFCEAKPVEIEFHYTEKQAVKAGDETFEADGSGGRSTGGNSGGSSGMSTGGTGAVGAN